MMDYFDFIFYRHWPWTMRSSWSWVRWKNPSQLTIWWRSWQYGMLMMWLCQSNCAVTSSWESKETCPCQMYTWSLTIGTGIALIMVGCNWCLLVHACVYMLQTVCMCSSAVELPIVACMPFIVPLDTVTVSIFLCTQYLKMFTEICNVLFCGMFHLMCCQTFWATSVVFKTCHSTTFNPRKRYVGYVQCSMEGACYCTSKQCYWYALLFMIWTHRNIWTSYMSI